MGVNEGRGVELEVQALAAGGRGVARHDGQVWFVVGGLPGDRVLAVPRVRRARYVEADRVELIRPSEDRRRAPCPIQDSCGGCPWMPLDEGVQRHWKDRLVRDALARIGGLETSKVEPVIVRGPTLGYRNKVELSLGRGASGAPIVGFHGRSRQAGIVDVSFCPIQHEAANRVLKQARKLLFDREGPWLSAFQAREAHRLVIRRSWLNGALLVALQESGARFPKLERFGSLLRQECPAVQGVVRILARPGRRGGARVETVLGQDWIDERIGELTFRLPATSFLQVSTLMASQLVTTVLECVGQREPGSVLDLYAGVGSIGLNLALRGARVTLCEADRAAVKCGRRTAGERGMTGARFVTGDVGLFLRDAKLPPPGRETIVANPPRGGLGRGVAEAILARRPGQVILVSCDPPTLARDLGRLVRGGLRVERVAPHEMFPQTAHIETVVSLRA